MPVNHGPQVKLKSWKLGAAGGKPKPQTQNASVSKSTAGPHSLKRMALLSWTFAEFCIIARCKYSLEGKSRPLHSMNTLKLPNNNQNAIQQHSKHCPVSLVNSDLQMTVLVAVSGRSGLHQHALQLYGLWFMWADILRLGCGRIWLLSKHSRQKLQSEKRDQTSSLAGILGSMSS